MCEADHLSVRCWIESFRDRCVWKSVATSHVRCPSESAVAIGVSSGHLVDASGFTLYDTPNACTGSCLTAWPPFNASQVPAATTGASQPAIALSAGQVTYNGHLLYYFNTDVIPGQINGSGVNGFSLVSP